jgi:hypothetical protein
LAPSLDVGQEMYDSCFFVPALCRETLHDLNIGFACLGVDAGACSETGQGDNLRSHHVLRVSTSQVDEHLSLLIGDRLGRILRDHFQLPMRANFGVRPKRLSWLTLTPRSSNSSVGCLADKFGSFFNFMYQRCLARGYVPKRGQ